MSVEGCLLRLLAKPDTDRLAFFLMQILLGTEDYVCMTRRNHFIMNCVFHCIVSHMNVTRIRIDMCFVS